MSIDNMTLLEAVETLSHIAELDLDPEIGILARTDRDQITLKMVEWLHHKEPEERIEAIRNIYSSVLNYLHQYYEHDIFSLQDPLKVEGFKTIMVLVGEAAKKIDRYQACFQECHLSSVAESKEYKNLSDFYKRNIYPTVNKGTLGKWLLAISAQAWSKKAKGRWAKKSIETQSIYIDLESVKRDTEYELFFIRKADGTRFFSPRLIRNLKLISNFGTYFGEEKKTDFLSDLAIWKDRQLHHAAKEIYKETKNVLDTYFREISHHKDHEIVCATTKAIFALMFAANPIYLKNVSGKKRALEYFEDFLKYLRAALKTRAFGKMSVYPSKKGHAIEQKIRETLHALTSALFIHTGSLEAVFPFIKHLIREGEHLVAPEHKEESHLLWSRLAASWQALSKVMKTHPVGPILKIIESIELGKYHQFEPLSADNIPHPIFSLYLPHQRIKILRIPCPIRQETTAQAEVIPEFHTFLATGKKHLTVNLQDRTSWRESARVLAMEALDKTSPVVTLATDTSFYHQLSPYHEEGYWERFASHLLDQSTDPQAGFYFPVPLKDKMEAFIPKAMESLHVLFFKNKNALTRTERQVFIDIFCLFIVLKVIDITEPNTISFCCKDGIDTGNLFAHLLWAFFLILNDELQEEVIKKLESSLYAPALLSRERLPLHDRFQRTLSVVRHLETVKKEMGAAHFSTLVKEAFKILFNTPFWTAHAK